MAVSIFLYFTYKIVLGLILVLLFTVFVVAFIILACFYNTCRCVNGFCDTINDGAAIQTSEDKEEDDSPESPPQTPQQLME